MGTARTVLSAGFKMKKKGLPVGRLGAHIKHGVGASFRDFWREHSEGYRAAAFPVSIK